MQSLSLKIWSNLLHILVQRFVVKKSGAYLIFFPLVISLTLSKFSRTCLIVICFGSIFTCTLLICNFNFFLILEIFSWILVLTICSSPLLLLLFFFLILYVYWIIFVYLQYLSLSLESFKDVFVSFWVKRFLPLHFLFLFRAYVLRVFTLYSF